MDEDSSISFGCLIAHPTDLPELEPMWSGFMFRACQPSTWTAGRCCFKRYQPPGWPWTWSQGVGRSGVSLAHLVLSTLSPVFHRASPSSLPQRLSAWPLGRPPAPMYTPARDYFFGQATTALRPILKACLSARRGAVHGVEKPEATGLSELVPGELHLPPLSPPCPVWIWGSCALRHTPLTHTAPLLPQLYPSSFWASGFSILGRAARLWESQPSVPWAQP